MNWRLPDNTKTFYPRIALVVAILLFDMVGDYFVGLWSVQRPLVNFMLFVVFNLVLILWDAYEVLSVEHLHRLRKGKK